MIKNNKKIMQFEQAGLLFPDLFNDQLEGGGLWAVIIYIKT